MNYATHDCQPPDPTRGNYKLGDFWTCECGKTWGMSMWHLPFPQHTKYLWVEPTVNTIK